MYGYPETIQIYFPKLCLSPLSSDRSVNPIQRLTSKRTTGFESKGEYIKLLLQAQSMLRNPRVIVRKK